MANIPGQSRRRFYERQAVIEAFAVVPPIVAAVYTIVAARANPALQWLWPLLTGAVVWLVFASIIKVLHASKRDADLAALEQHDGLQAALHVLRASVAERLALPADDGSLRATIHRVVPPYDNPHDLEQLLPYVGGRGGAAYRKFPIRAGIIGRAAREKDVFTHRRKKNDYDAFLYEMIHDWGYTDADARQLNKDVKASIAVPILSPGNKVVVAVLYMDSSRSDLFDDATKAIVINGCKGIATYMAQRYNLFNLRMNEPKS